jgi:hypothetical protein
MAKWRLSVYSAVALLGMVCLPLLSLSPANAASFTYAVDYTISGVTVTGSITTNCDLCTITTSDVTAWNFSVPTLPLSISGTAPISALGDLSVSPAAITFTPSTNFTEFSGSAGCVVFDLLNCGGIPDPGVFGAENTSNFFLITEVSTADVTIATAATPLPAALPLFATGLGGLGLLGWRRKRKAQAI